MAAPPSVTGQPNRAACHWLRQYCCVYLLFESATVYTSQGNQAADDLQSLHVKLLTVYKLSNNQL